jgi:diguanylate cyclase (GGDEF)-like protein/PAS domain S-box-containing protein
VKVKDDIRESSHSVIAVTWPFLGGMLLMLLISLGSINALSAMRAYVAGLSVWIGAEANTSEAMHRYLARPSVANFAALEQPIKIWAGDNTARLEMMKPRADYELAGRGLRAGGNHPANIDGMVWLFRAMQIIPAWQEPLNIWREADHKFEQYLPLKQRMQSRLAAGGIDLGELNALGDEIDAIHSPLVALEHQFARAIDDDARQLTALLLTFLAISTLALLAAGYLAARHILKRTDEMAVALRAIEKLAFEEHERAAVLLRSIGDAVISTNRSGVVQFLNSAAEELIGVSMAEACGRPIDEVFRLAHSGDAPAPSLRAAIESFMSEANDTLTLGHASELVRHDGSITPIGERAARLRNRAGDVIGLVLVMRDVTAERRLSDQLRHQATHDALTGLANRSHFEHELDLTLHRCQATGQTYSAAFIDLDQFKIVNDTGGHAAGDELIRRVGAAISAQLRDGDLLARLGGDEFGLVLSNCDAEAAVLITERIRMTIEALRFLSDGCNFSVNASIGVVHNDPALHTATDVLRAADRACYAAKETGRNRVHVYNPHDRDIEGCRGEMRWITRLHAALEQDRFVLYSQEIRSIRARVGAPSVCHEVLLRLRDEQGQMVPPMAFIPAAERFGLMPQIDRWVIEHAFAEQSRRTRFGIFAPRCMINLSGASLDNPELADFIDDRLKHYDLPRGSIGFELTETAAISRLAAAVKVMNRLKELGCPVALDDFGSGMSSYGYLRELPVDIVKIDGSFVRDMSNDPVAYAMVEAMHNVARAMGIRTVAEWVENDATLTALKRLGVDFAQGRGIGTEQPWSEANRTAECEPEVSIGMAVAVR